MLSFVLAGFFLENVTHLAPTAPPFHCHGKRNRQEEELSQIMEVSVHMDINRVNN